MTAVAYAIAALGLALGAFVVGHAVGFRAAVRHLDIHRAGRR